MERIILFLVLGLLFGLVAFIIRFIRRKRRHMKLLAVRDRIENVYLVARHPITDEAPDIGELEDLCEFVEHAVMEETVAEWETMLKVSGNRFWDNPEIKPSFKIQIHCFFFRDGEFVNEDFDEYAQRVKDEIKADRAIRHETLKRMDGGWYRFAHHGQNVVTWSKE